MPRTAKQEVVWGECRVVPNLLIAHSAGFGGWTHSVWKGKGKGCVLPGIIYFLHICEKRNAAMHEGLLGHFWAVWAYA